MSSGFRCVSRYSIEPCRVGCALSMSGGKKERKTRRNEEPAKRLNENIITHNDPTSTTTQSWYNMCSKPPQRWAPHQADKTCFPIFSIFTMDFSGCRHECESRSEQKKYLLDPLADSHFAAASWVLSVVEWLRNWMNIYCEELNCHLEYQFIKKTNEKRSREQFSRHSICLRTYVIC